MNVLEISSYGRIVYLLRSGTISIIIITLTNPRAHSTLTTTLVTVLHRTSVRLQGLLFVAQLVRSLLHARTLQPPLSIYSRSLVTAVTMLHKIEPSRRTRHLCSSFKAKASHLMAVHEIFMRHTLEALEALEAQAETPPSRCGGELVIGIG